MKVGFTGTQKGMSYNQGESLKKILEDLKPEEFHDGDCIGADDEAHTIANFLGIKTVLHPPSIDDKRAFNKAAEVRLTAPYLERNKHIVDETEILIVVPCEYTQQLRSGTWSTYRYAKKKQRQIRIIFPDGSIKVEYPNVKAF